jgi:hypothetical protein
MEDMIKKLTALRDMLKAVKQVKPIQSPIQPIPTLKAPPKPSLAASSTPTKLPGIGPDSKKDPKKIAEQIKSGKMSTKTQKIMLKGEVYKIDKNGQWSLEKADPDFKKTKLEKGWTAADGSAARNWQHSGMRSNIKSLKRLEGKDRFKALQNIQKETESRVNPKNGIKEYKLYRSAPKDDQFHEKNLTSWTTTPSMAHYWGNLQNTPDTNDPEWKDPQQRVIYAWIPERHIHSHLPTMTGTKHEKGGENEVLVEPHKVNIFHTEVPKSQQLSVAKANSDQWFLEPSDPANI